MSILLSYLPAFLFNWVIFFAICYIVVEYGQSYLYDESTPNALAKVVAGSAILALLLLWTRTSYDTMLTRDWGKTVVLSIAAFGIFTLIFQFQPWHGLAIGVASVLLMAGFATMAVESFSDRNRAVPPSIREPAKPLRRGATPVTISPMDAPAPATKK